MTPFKVTFLPEEQVCTIMLEHVNVVRASPKKENCIITMSCGLTLHVKDKTEQSMTDLLKNVR